MGTSLVLKTADFSQSGFKVDQVILDYFSGTITPISFPMAVAGTYSASVLLKTEGVKFNYVKVRTSSLAQKFNLVKYNKSSHEITILSVMEPSDGISEFISEEPIQLNENEMVGFTKISGQDASHNGYKYSEDQGIGKTFDFVYEASGELANATAWNYCQPMVKVMLTY